MKQKLQEIIDFFELEEGYEREDIITDMLSQIKQLQGHDTDEIDIKWDGKILMTLNDFVRQYHDIVINGVCNVIKSFQKEL